ncbi:MAG: DinB family protein [Candidatus Eisenbacteria bacterium]|nr:DinB family protein [Candidatus Eisenbacteria bacterium]
MFRIDRPEPDEFFEYYGRYIGLSGEDAMATLRASAAATPRLLSGITEPQAMFRYAPGKWSVKQVLGHIIDCERVFMYRALTFARGDQTSVPGFEEDEWMEHCTFDRRALSDIVDEYVAVRAATIALAGSLDEVALTRRGTANGRTMSTRAALHCAAGHELHHVSILKERYGLA